MVQDNRTIQNKYISKIMRPYNYLFFVILAFVLTSCDSDIRSLKKFESRLNAEEYSCAAVYLYDGDLPNYSFFINEVRDENSNLMIKLKKSEKTDIDGSEAIIADFELVNASSKTINYFKNIGYTITNNSFRDTIKIRQTVEGDRLSFNWGLKTNEENHYSLASIVGDKVQTLNIRSIPSTNGKIIGEFKKGRDILVDNLSTDENWKHCFWVNKTGDIDDGYIYANNLGTGDSSFWELGLFDSMTLTVAIIVLVVIVVFFVFGSSLFGMIVGIPGAGIIIIVAAILGFIYTIYQLLEKILFELFIINLPY